MQPKNWIYQYNSYQYSRGFKYYVRNMMRELEISCKKAFSHRPIEEQNEPNKNTLIIPFTGTFSKK